MKKYLLILMLTMMMSPCVFAQAVKRTTKNPNFFVPEGALRNNTGTEKLSFVKKQQNRNTLAISEQKTALKGVQFEAAPIEDILKKQSYLSKQQLYTYRNDIVHSYKLTIGDLQKLLQREYESVNKETIRMEAVLQHLKTASPAYRLANLQIEKQISQDMVKNRRRYKKLKQKFTEIIEKESVNKNIYVLEAKNDMFWRRYELSKILGQSRHTGYVQWKASHHFRDVTYISIFDSDYSYVFSYYRQHLNMLQNRRIAAPNKISGFYIEQNVVNIYQKLFDGYLDDLNRIGKGLDVINPVLLRQLNEMQDKNISI